jgi:predicted choloylglycine hydrolase/cephalosporin-C deacetylase-like acetyl esterase
VSAGFLMMVRYFKKFGFLLICFFFVFKYASSGFCFSNSELSSLMEDASLKENEGIFILHVKGSPYQMGYQHGKLLKDQIKVLYQNYLLATLKEKTKDEKRFKAYFNLFKKKAKELEKFIPEEYKEEIRGIADGSGLSYSDVLIIHTFLDVLSYPKFFKHGFKNCTNFVLLNEASQESRLIHGRNLSWPSKGLLEKQSVVIFYQPKNGNAFVTLSWPGICGVLTGMNEKGLTFGETSVGTAESSLRGTPAFILFRQALQYSDTLYDAIRIIASSERTTGYTLTLSDAKLNKACVIEFTNQHYSVRFPKDNQLISTNHYQDTALFETMKSVYQDRKLEDSISYQRLIRMQELIKENLGKIDYKKAEELLGDQTMCTKGTFLSCIFEPQVLKFHVSIGNSNIREVKFMDFDLSTELDLALPQKQEYMDTEEFYSYKKEEIQYKKTLIKETAKYKKYIITFRSIIKTDFSDNTVYLKYYEPKYVGNFPIVLVLPHSYGTSEGIEGQFCQALIEDGIGALVVNMAYQEKPKSGHRWLKEELQKEDLTKIYNLFKQLVIESKRGIDWLEDQPNVDKEHIGILGISLGATVAPIIAGSDGRIKSAVYILGGGDISNIIYSGTETPFFKQRLLQQNISPLEFERKYSVIDPLTFAFKAKNIPTIMYNSIFDTVIPKESTLKMWQALERPKIYWAPATHYTAVLFIGNAKYVITKHFDSTLRYKLAKEVKGLNIEAKEHVQLSHENFLGKKIRVTGSGKYGDREKRIRIGLLKEDIFSSPFFSGFDLSGRWEGDERYDLKGQGRDIYIGMNITKKAKFTLKFENQDITMYKIDNNAPQILKDDQGNSQISDVAFILEKSSLDNRYYPTKGTYHSLEWDYAAKGLGSDYDFSRLAWQSRGYITPGRFFTFCLRTKLGWMEEFGETNDVPYFERFFAGGSSTIRGYKGRQVGPKDDRDFSLGGNFIWVNNFEMRFPIYKQLTGATFFDVGGLWSRPNKFSFEDLKCGTGFGLRYITKWGVARIDYGVRLTHDKDEPRSRVHMSFGIPF